MRSEKTLKIGNWRTLRYYNGAFATEAESPVEIVVYKAGSYSGWRGFVVVFPTPDRRLVIFDDVVGSPEAAARLIAEMLDGLAAALVKEVSP